jgi:hypothetical protein
MANKKKPNRTITPADKKAAENLRRIWAQKKDKLGLTQEEVGQDAFGSNQSLISQYLAGTIALNPVAVMKFAKVLECSPLDIRKDLEELMDRDEGLSPEAKAVARKWQSLPSRLRDDVKKHIDNLLEAMSHKLEPDDTVRPHRPN